MATRTYYICLRTRRGLPRLREEINRELFIKTLKVLTTNGRFTVEAFSMLPRKVRLLVTTQEQGQAIAETVATTTERIMQLACRTRRGAFWERTYECRPVVMREEVLGITAMILAEPRRRKGETAQDFLEYTSEGKRWRSLTASSACSPQ